MSILLECLFLSTISLLSSSPLPDSFFPDHPISRSIPNPPGIFPAGWSDLYSRAGIQNHPILSPFPPNVNLVNDTLSLIYSNFSPTFPEVFNDTKLIDDIYRRQRQAEDSLLNSPADLPFLTDEEIITVKDSDNAETAVEEVVYSDREKRNKNEEAHKEKESKQEENTNEKREEKESTKSKQEENTNEKREEKESTSFVNEGKELTNKNEKDSNINPQPKWIESSEKALPQSEENLTKHDEMQLSKPAEIETTENTEQSKNSYEDMNASTMTIRKEMDEENLDEKPSSFSIEQTTESIYEKEVREMLSNQDKEEKKDTNQEKMQNQNQDDTENREPNLEMQNEETNEQMEDEMMSTTTSRIEKDKKESEETGSKKETEGIVGTMSTTTSKIEEEKEVKEAGNNKEEEKTNRKEDKNGANQGAVTVETSTILSEIGEQKKHKEMDSNMKEEATNQEENVNNLNQKEMGNDNLDDDKSNPIKKDKEMNVESTIKITENKMTIASTSKDETRKTEMNFQEGGEIKKEMNPIKENNEIILEKKETQILPETNPGELLNSDLDVIHNGNETNVVCSPNGTKCWSTSKSILMTTGILIGIIVGLVTIVGLMTGLSVYTFHHWKLRRRSRPRRSCSINNIERAFTPTPYTTRRPLYENEAMFQDNDSPVNTLEAITVENYRENAI